MFIRKSIQSVTNLAGMPGNMGQPRNGCHRQAAEQRMVEMGLVSPAPLPERGIGSVGLGKSPHGQIVRLLGAQNAVFDGRRSGIVAKSRRRAAVQGFGNQRGIPEPEFRKILVQPPVQN